MNEPNIYELKQTFLSMAGSGDPWNALTRLRKNILRALHDNLSLEEIAEIFELDIDHLISEIAPLVATNLVRKDNNRYMPTFFVTDLSETEQVYDHSKETGKILSEILFSKWADLEKIYSKLTLSRLYPFKDQAFILVGSRILDIGLLGALSKDKTLLEPAPSRPGPGRPDARYYFYMVEGETEHLGKYGQDQITLPWSDWYFLTFGQSWIQGTRNKMRDDFEKKCTEIINSGNVESPESLAEKLGAPYLSKNDSILWTEAKNRFSDYLLEAIKGQSDRFKEFYNTLNASKYTHNSFGEFFCWYIHLAYAWAIDNLVGKNLVHLPPEYFRAIILYRKGHEGLLV